jgi:hypothetical protein
MEQPLTKLLYKTLNFTSHGSINYRFGYYQHNISHQQYTKTEGLLTGN